MMNPNSIQYATVQESLSIYPSTGFATAAMIIIKFSRKAYRRFDMDPLNYYSRTPTHAPEGLLCTPPSA